MGEYLRTLFVRPATRRSTAAGRFCLLAALAVCPLHLVWILAVWGHDAEGVRAAPLWDALPVLVPLLSAVFLVLTVTGVRLLNRRDPLDVDAYYRPRD